MFRSKPPLALLALLIICTTPLIAQDQKLADLNSSIETSIQGNAYAIDMDLAVSSINGEIGTKNSAYYFDDWDTKGEIFVKDKGKVRIDGVNLNLFDNTLQAVYEENKVFTFDSDRLMKIVINDKVFRIFEIDNKLRIMELFYESKQAVYKYFDVKYVPGSLNTMLNRSANKFIKNEKYFILQDGELLRIKMTKKAIAAQLETETIGQEAILSFIKKGKLRVKKEEDFVKVLNFVNR